MNWLIKSLAGSKMYKVSVSNPSVVSARLMSQYPETVFDVKVLNESEFTFWCLAPFSKGIRGYLSEFECDLSEKASRGLFYFLKRKIKKPGLVAGLLLASLTVIYQNFAVWDITISGNRRIGDNEIISTLEKAGIKIGKNYDRHNLSAVCNRFILLDDRFSWISVNMSGNVAFVEVKERSKKNNDSEAPSESGFIASCDCIIERPEVIRGTSLVKHGDIVEKGHMLISPVSLGNDGNEYITGAQGKVFAKTYEQFTVMIPYEATSAELTGETEAGYTLSFLGLQMNFENPFGKQRGNYLCIKKSQRVKLSEEAVLPIKRNITEKRAYREKQLRYSKEEAEDIAYQTMYQKISRDLYDGEILSTEFNAYENEESFILCCTVECIRNVAQRTDE